MKAIDLARIVKIGLEAIQADGLYLEEDGANCGCSKNELFPCDYPREGCCAATKKDGVFVPVIIISGESYAKDRVEVIFNLLSGKVGTQKMNTLPPGVTNEMTEPNKKCPKCNGTVNEEIGVCIDCGNVVGLEENDLFRCSECGATWPTSAGIVQCVNCGGVNCRTN